MLALFEVLSFKGWLDVRDVLIKALGPVSNFLLNKIYETFLIYHLNVFRFMQFIFTFIFFLDV